MFVRFQRGKGPIKRPRALCRDNPSSCYSLPRDLCSVFPALQHGAVVARDLTEPAGVPGWALCPLLRHLPGCLPTGAVGGAFLPIGNVVSITSAWLCFKWDWKWQQQGCVLHPWLVLSRRKACHSQFWFLDRTMPTASLKNLEIHTCDLLWLIEVLSVIVACWCHLKIECLFFFLKLHSQYAIVCWFGDCLGSLKSYPRLWN